MFEAGDKVRWITTGAVGTIVGDCFQKDSFTIWSVDFGNRIGRIPETQLEKIEDGYTMFDSFRAHRFKDYNSFRQTLTHKRIQGGLTNIVYSMRYGDVQFLPYQFKPVFKFISSTNGRLLIADEVGLGKTIESLYIWKELQAREGAKRLLVVCPAMLRSKWRNDMVRHFGIKADIVKAGELRSRCEDSLNDLRLEFALITSMQGIRFKSKYREEIIVDDDSSDVIKFNKLLEDNASLPASRRLFDLVIIDEAAMVVNSATASFKTASRLSEASKNLLLLSATPVNNTNEDLFSLLRLLSPEEYFDVNIFKSQFDENRNIASLAHLFYYRPDDADVAIRESSTLIDEILDGQFTRGNRFFSNLQNRLPEILSSDKLRRSYYDLITDQYFYSDVFTRSRKRDVLKTAVRYANTVYYDMSDAEMGVYTSISEHLKHRSIQIHDRIVMFSIMARQRELASSIPAALMKWKKMGSVIDIDDDDSDGSIEEYEDFYNDYLNADEMEMYVDSMDSLDSAFSDDVLHLSDETIEYLEAHDSKYKMLIDTVREKMAEAEIEGRHEKIVLFSFFRNTLKYLERRLREDGVYSVIIMGGMTPEQKDIALEQFRDRDLITVLLSSEVGAEGLDLQFARVEINYDLPWNPMKLEQRIGRIDRIGQEAERIIIVNLLSRNTIEDRILIKLYDKLDIFTHSIGELDPVLGEMTQKLEMILLSPNLTDTEKTAQALAEIDRINNIIEMNRSLEESAGLSKAFSDSIIEYVNAADNNNRYIRKEDLINYLSDYFAMHSHGSHFLPGGQKDVYSISLSAIDRGDYGDFCTRNGFFDSASYQRPVACCFPQGKKNTKHYNIDINSPIVKWVISETEKSKLFDKDCCFAFNVPKSAIEDESIEKGAYVFFVGYFNCDGIKRKKELLYSACSVRDLNMIEPQAAEKLISQSLFDGYPVNDLDSEMRPIDQDSLIISMNKCYEQEQNRFNMLFDEMSIENDSIFERQKAKTMSFFESRITSTKNTLRDLKAKVDYGDKEEKARYGKVIPMHESKLSNLRADYEEAMERINKRKTLIPFDEKVAIGVVFVR